MAATIGGAKMDFMQGSDALVTYSDIIRTGNAHLASHYFCDNVILDWFGRTIAGRDNVLNFLFEEVQLSSHDIIEVKSREEDIHKRYTMARAIARFRPTPENEYYDLDDDSGFGFGSCDSSFSSEGSQTPCSKMASELSRLYVSDHEDILPLNSVSPPMRTPFTTRFPREPTMQRRPSEKILKSLKELEVPKNIRFINAAGVISGGSLQHHDIYNPEPIRPWSKHSHIQIGYYHLPPAMGESICFSFILYNNDMPCRKNLSKVFDECDSSD